MLRGAIGYLLGMVCCFLMVANYFNSLFTGEYVNFIVSIIISVILFIVLMIWCHKHHVKMRNKYYGRFKNKRTW